MEIFERISKVFMSMGQMHSNPYLQTMNSEGAQAMMDAMVDDESVATLNTSPCDDCVEISWGMCKCCSHRTFSPAFEVEAEETEPWQADPAVIREVFEEIKEEYKNTASEMPIIPPGGLNLFGKTVIKESYPPTPCWANARGRDEGCDYLCTICEKRIPDRGEEPGVEIEGVLGGFHPAASSESGWAGDSDFTLTDENLKTAMKEKGDSEQLPPGEFKIHKKATIITEGSGNFPFFPGYSDEVRRHLGEDIPGPLDPLTDADRETMKQSWVIEPVEPIDFWRRYYGDYYCDQIKIEVD